MVLCAISFGATMIFDIVISEKMCIRDSFEEVVKLDLEYIDNWSIWLDIKLLIETVFVVLFQRGAT